MDHNRPNNEENRLSWLDKMMRRAVGDGRSEHLQGAGKPLQFEDESHVPPDMRMAYRIMRQNDVVPEWMELGQTLEKDCAEIRRRLRQGAQRYRQSVVDAQQRDSVRAELEAREQWQRLCDKIGQEIVRYNSRLLTYNVSIPPAISQRVPMRLQTEVEQALKD